jgi:hypothetical protein
MAAAAPVAKPKEVEMIFTFEVDDRTASFGETETQERLRVANLLHNVARDIASGRPIGGAVQEIIDQGGGAQEPQVIGSFQFGAGSVTAAT